MNKLIKAMVIGVGISLMIVGSGHEASGKKETKKEASNDGKVTFYIARHGKTLFNTMDRVQGWSDTPLTEQGREVAEDLGRGLKDIKFKSAYSSDLGRARETAQLVLATNGQKKLAITPKKTLREACYGKFEGDFNENMKKAMAEYYGYETLDNNPLGKEMFEKGADAVSALDTEYHMGEDAKTIKERMQTTLKQMAKKEAKNGGGNVLVVGHGMSINIMVSDMTDKYTGEGLKNASVTKIIYNNGKFKVESIGDTSYFEKGKKE
ncbi:hypothetical protein CKN73_04285 [Carnobacterium divergens]|uniref:histidine phosphatase family protein n=1 Tax=Carnobacterium divergens TaxID=2748 RepID=UPI0010715FB1|nr:histidine phosphatase family protein [Carnobacterium divergens]TFJ42771.1 hypothetical protein CKN77_04215 [Carnobacterium divergens]TFJ51311.1 hypothetical protein CKN73_04285 [Carnobacterium divergens]TFJ56308.1 hypothetical protein CKN83_04230 [Carnobacterium divergens]TFJ63845.1 hypothetical protein CKN89_04310 [Carnobacterium divergens]TFJ73003.1 hypothetical protein CKN91_04235 [Carnobacterium divergens]